VIIISGFLSIFLHFTHVFKVLVSWIIYSAILCVPSYRSDKKFTFSIHTVIKLLHEKILNYHYIFVSQNRIIVGQKCLCDVTLRNGNHEWKFRLSSSAKVARSEEIKKANLDRPLAVSKKAKFSSQFC